MWNQIETNMMYFLLREIPSTKHMGKMGATNNVEVDANSFSDEKMLTFIRIREIYADNPQTHSETIIDLFRLLT